MSSSKNCFPTRFLRKKGGEITVYEVTGKRIHFGEAVAYSALQLSVVSPDDKDLQSHICWYVEELGPPRYAELARAVLSGARSR